MRDLEIPRPKADEVCIRVRATAVTMSDIYIRSSNLPLWSRIPMRIFIGLTRPRKSVIGLVLSGEVVTTGKNVTDFRPGDEVYGLTGFQLGAYAEYACIREKASNLGCIARKPGNITHEEATSVAYGGMLALQVIEKFGPIHEGQKVLIYGASSTTGTIALQIAKHYGAEVTGVCSTRNLDLIRSLGADKVLDYSVELAANQLESYDLILDTVGKAKGSALKDACKKTLLPSGHYVSIDDDRLPMPARRLDLLRELTEAGAIKPVLDRTYPLERICEAHAYVEKGHKVGGVAIRVG